MTMVAVLQLLQAAPQPSHINRCQKNGCNCTMKYAEVLGQSTTAPQLDTYRCRRQADLKQITVAVVAVVQLLKAAPQPSSI